MYKIQHLLRWKVSYLAFVFNAINPVNLTAVIYSVDVRENPFIL